MSYRLRPAEIAFLEEYCTVMKLLTILQSEVNTHGMAASSDLPATTETLKASTNVCLPLISAIQDGLQRHFGGMMYDCELIAAAILPLVQDHVDRQD